jgi:ribosome biogenesis GTPase A
MRTTDIVVEVLDARVPFSSCSPMIEELRKENQRPALKVLNKVDVADPARTDAWLAHYNAQPGTTAIALSANKPGAAAKIPKACLALFPTKGTKLKPLRLMILGIPNAGKSTLMNALLKKRIAAVGDEPAVTKMQARHALGPGMWIVDTPGMMWPRISQECALKLAATHSIGRNAYEEENVAHALAHYLLEHYRPLLAARYGPLPETVDDEGEAHTLLVHIGAKMSVGADAYARAAMRLLNDFRSGTLGRITLETVAEMQGKSHVSR